MSSARRSLLTATAAATLLGALWFVPSAHASAEHAGPDAAAASDAASPQATQQARAISAAASDTPTGSARPATAGPSGTSTASDGTALADTGSVDTTPYVVGGTLFLGVGAGFVVYSIRRERLGF
ncbi:hypothetical protein ACIQU5_00070 [Streptomyces sp. NPDC090306]|uniref:hypothetical protein n=1 Tax=unclassified Streptomyces TaxID=2593676 RepID=UPI0036E2D44A